MADQLPRAVRNNNPGNIRVGDPWQGLMPVDEMNDAQRAEKAFCVFQSPKWGFRALDRVLISYQDKYEIRTIAGIIARWAPPSENDTGSYVKDVCAKSGFTATQSLDLQSYQALSPIAKAISTHESGGWFFDDKDLEAGLRLAGVEPPLEALAQSRTIKTGIPAATGVAGITAIIQQLQPSIEIISKVKEYWPYAGITILVVAIGAMTWFRIDDWMRSKR